MSEQSQLSVHGDRFAPRFNSGVPAADDVDGDGDPESIESVDISNNVTEEELFRHAEYGCVDLGANFSAGCGVQVRIKPNCIRYLAYDTTSYNDNPVPVMGYQSTGPDGQPFWLYYKLRKSKFYYT